MAINITANKLFAAFTGLTVNCQNYFIMLNCICIYNFRKVMLVYDDTNMVK